MALDGVQQGRARGGALSLDLAEGRRLRHAEPDEEPDSHEHDREEEGYPPAPREEGLVGELRGDEREEPGGEQEPGRDADLRPGTVEPSPVAAGVLDRE